MTTNILIEKIFKRKTLMLVITGKTTIKYSPLFSCMTPIFRMFKILVPYKGNDIHTKVIIKTEPNDEGKVQFIRELHLFKQKTPYVFKTYMRQVTDDEIVEMMEFGLGYQMKLIQTQNKSKYEYKNFMIKYRNKFYPFHFNWLIYVGIPYVEKKDLSDDQFEMCIKIISPWFGDLYTMTGIFNIVSSD